MGFADSFGRVHDELRISVTDRCNLRCTYCMPEEPVWFPRDGILHFEEIHRLVQVFVRRGVTRFRITGGEPLLRRDLTVLVGMLASTPGVEELSLTTNGLLLPDLAPPLAEAGLQRVNVSLDTLVPERFRSLTRRDGLDRVLHGLDVAAQVGLRPLKINTVLLRGVNDDEVLSLTETSREHGWQIRFIEFMPLENGGTWDMSRVVSGSDTRRAIEARWPLVPDPGQTPDAPATTYHFADGKGTVGFINSVTAPFCEHCTRLRLTADGKLSACLYATDETDLKAPLRQGASDEVLERVIAETVMRKGRGGALEILDTRQAIPLARTMHQIGG
jgi:cyclic pyranopterin phosphate synthase